MAGTKSLWHEGESDQAPIDYEPEPTFYGRIMHRDVLVPMQDGVSLCIDIYLPDTATPLPSLLAISSDNKELLGPGFHDHPSHLLLPVIATDADEDEAGAR